MRTNFRDIDSGKTIDLGAFLKSGADVSPMDIPLKGDTTQIATKAPWTKPTNPPNQGFLSRFNVFLVNFFSYL